MFDQETRQEIASIAARLGVEAAALLAVAQVESGGKAKGWNDLPLIRWEGHYFYRFLNKMSDGEKLERAVKQGLAAIKAGAVKNPLGQKERYALLAKASKIDEAAALMSCSWGVGQVMGSNFASLGFNSVQELVARAKASVAGQVDVMARFIEATRLTRYLKTKNWRAFALAYNGQSAIERGYHLKIEAAYQRFRAR